MSSPSTLLPDAPAKTCWAAILSIAVTVATLLTSELIPGSILTSMAEGHHITPGMAGQAVTATALAAMIASLVTGRLAGNVDRRYVVMFFSVLLIMSLQAWFFYRRSLSCQK